MTAPLSPRAARSAFTLVEVMISMAISLLVSGGALWLVVAGVRSSALATSGAMNDLSQWGIASRLWVDARIANGITVYPSYTTAHVERWLRRVVNDGGNFMVFSLSDAVDNHTTYSKITGYYFVATSGTSPATGTIYRFDHVVSASEQASYKPLEDILKDNRTAIMASAKVVAGNVNTFMTTSVPSGSTTVTIGNVFLCRAAGTVASLACSVSSASSAAERTSQERNKTYQEKVIEATFFIRG
jgi:prepilin-type N-terminal cleavage/methylation domain-containing protein